MYRYVLTDADGKATRYVYQQRPAALLNAARRGLAVWDSRDEVVIHEGDWLKRLGHLRGHERSLRAELKETEDLITATLIRLPKADFQREVGS